MTHESIKSSSNDISPRDLAIIAGAVILISAIYLLSSQFNYDIGFPLDDSWIHQTYARNLALRGEWAFRPGVVSAGSTAPLWSALLAIGYIFHLAPYIWTYFLGAATLFALAGLCEWAVRKIIGSYQPRIPWVGLFFAFEWHFAWAGMSGMETLLHALIVTTILVLLMTNTPRYLTLGLLAGLSVWIRPDGMTLIGPILMTILFTRQDNKERINSTFLALFGFASLFIPYLFFNLAVGGTPMPNTFYAKQAEYTAWREISIFSRLGQLSLQLLVGPGLFLLPGVIIWLVKSIQNRMWANLAVFIWCVGYLGIYVMRMPVYQHGRYIMPAMPIFFLFGLLAFFEYEKRIPSTRVQWAIRTSWRAILVMLVFSFIFLGAGSYAQDVELIEGEMVATARWAAGNLPQDALIAAHDIGALGYYDDHELIDLAGLISPEVVPFIRDERQLEIYLNERGADYIIAFPDFYPSLTGDLEMVFVTHNSSTTLLGRDNMAVYLWKSP